MTCMLYGVWFASMRSYPALPCKILINPTHILICMNPRSCQKYTETFPSSKMLHGFSASSSMIHKFRFVLIREAFRGTQRHSQVAKCYMEFRQVAKCYINSDLYKSQRYTEIFPSSKMLHGFSPSSNMLNKMWFVLIRKIGGQASTSSVRRGQMMFGVAD